jgi:hypothetical protein
VSADDLRPLNLFNIFGLFLNILVNDLDRRLFTVSDSFESFDFDLQNKNYNISKSFF